MQCYERQLMLIYIQNILRTFYPNCSYDLLQLSEILDLSGAGNFVELQKLDCAWLSALARSEKGYLKHAA